MDAAGLELSQVTTASDRYVKISCTILSSVCQVLGDGGGIGMGRDRNIMGVLLEQGITLIHTLFIIKNR